MKTTILWQRLSGDGGPGHDACAVTIDSTGKWRLQGSAMFSQKGQPASLQYVVSGDAAWRTDHGRVSGFLGESAIDVTIIRMSTASGHLWTSNGAEVMGLERCAHLDLSFTPATNFPQVRSLDRLVSGQSAEVPVAWLDPPATTLALLPQRYERRNERAFWYEAPTVGYSDLLEVEPGGLIRTYPKLWRMVAVRHNLGP